MAVCASTCLNQRRLQRLADMAIDGLEHTAHITPRPCTASEALQGNVLQNYVLPVAHAETVFGV